MILKRFAAFAVASLSCLTAPARAWEVVGGNLPTFAQSSSTAASAASPWASPWASFTASPISGPNVGGYSYRMGKNLLVGIDTRSGFASGSPFGGFGAGLDYSSTNVKVGYDMGALRPYVTAGFGEMRSSTFGGSTFTPASNTFQSPSNPFATTTNVTTVGAGFDYAITNNLTLGLGISATQATRGGLQ
jgi:opacity protein-like surface antigen